MNIIPGGSFAGITAAEAFTMARAILPELAIALLFIYIAKWKIFRRAGFAGWKCLIPFYGGYLTYKIGWRGKYYWYSVAMTVLMLANHVMIKPKGSLYLTVLQAAIDFVTIALNIGIYPMLAVRFDYKLFFMIGSLLFTEAFLLFIAWGKHAYSGNPEEGIAPEPGYCAPAEPSGRRRLEDDDDDDFYDDDDDGGHGGIWPWN